MITLLELQRQMAIAVLDWFLLEGAEPIYEKGGDDDNDVELFDDLYEVRMSEFEVFVGPPTESGPWVVEVAVSVVPYLPLEVDVAESLVAPARKQLSERHMIDVFPTEGLGSNSSIWLATPLTQVEVESSAIDQILRTLLAEARSLQAHLSN